MALNTTLTAAAAPSLSAAVIAKLTAVTGALTVGGGGGVLPTTLPLPAISAAPSLAAGTYRLVAGYAGPAVRVVRVSDSVEADIAFRSDGILDVAAAKTFAGIANSAQLTPDLLQVKTVYDQSGNGRHLTGVNGPRLTTQKAIFGGTYPETPYVLSDSIKYVFTDLTPAVSRHLLLPTDLATDRTNHAAFMISAAPVSLQNNRWFAIGTSNGTDRESIQTQVQASPNGVVFQSRRGAASVSDAYLPMMPRANRHLLGYVSRPTGKDVYSLDLKASVAAEDAGTLTGGSIGLSTTTASFGEHDFYAFVMYPSTPSDAEFDAVRSSLIDGLVVRLRANRIVLAGSSTPQGYGGTENASYLRYLNGSISRFADIYNVAVAGRTASTAVAEGPTYVDPLVESSSRNIAMYDVGSNDFAGGALAADVYAAIKTAIQARKAAGFQKAIVCTVPPRVGVVDSSTAAGIQRIAYNDMLIAGWANDIGADGIVLFHEMPELADPTNLTYYRPDQIHKRNAGFVAMAAKAAPVIEMVLRKASYPAITGAVKIGFGATALAGWNKTVAATGRLFSDLLDTAGNATGISFTITSPGVLYTNGQGAQRGTETGAEPFPNSILLNYLYRSAGNMGFKFDGLDPAGTYRLRLIGSRSGTGTRNVDYSVNGGAIQTLNVFGNTEAIADFTGLTPIDGTLSIGVAMGSGNTTFTHLGGIILERVS